MKRRCAGLVLLAAVLSAGAAGEPRGAPDRRAVLEAARELMQKARYCALVTVGEDGHPQARAVDAFAPEEDMTVWIATNPVTRKVREVTRDPRVTLYYFEPSGTGYVTLVGSAAVVRDPAEKARRWKDDWAAFYKDENRGDDYVLIRVAPSRLEIVSYAHGILNEPASWRPVAVTFP